MRAFGRVEREWRSPRLGKALIFITACFAVHWWFHIPPSNYSLIAMAVVAGLMALRPEMSGWERSAWAVALIVFALVEIRAIKHDDAVRDAAQRAALQEERQHFGDIASGLTTAIRENQQNFNSVMANADTLLKANLGGDGFCYMLMEPGLLAWKGQATPEFVHSGRYPLYNVSALIVDDVKAEKITGKMEKGKGVILAAIAPAETNISVGDLPAGSSHILWDKPFLLDSNPVRLTILFTARNGSWQEQINVAQVNGKWLQAIVVYRMIEGNQHKVLHEDIQKDFPRGPNGKVDWGWSGN